MSEQKRAVTIQFELHTQMGLLGRFQHEEVVGVDSDGCVVQWDAINQRLYNSGETPEQFGIAGLTTVEKLRIPWLP